MTIINRLLLISLAILVMSSCASSTRLMQKGRYDEAITKAVSKLMKNPASTDDALALDRSYRLANDSDLDRIKFLKQESNPDSWDEILYRYENLRNRQDRIKPVMPLNIDGRTVKYAMVDYDAEIINAKDRAAEFFYNNAKELMKRDTRQAYRQAYDEFSQASRYRAGQFPDISELMEEARYKGISRVLVEVNNMTRFRLSPRFISDLLEMNTASLESKWVEYYMSDMDRSLDYDYYILIILDRIDVSADNVSQTDKMYKKQVEDGFEYVLDRNGNVMKDTAGNDIRLPKYRTLSCTVIESYQHKTALIAGNVEIQSDSPRKLIKKEPIGAEHVFEHRSARAVGDPEVLDEKALRLIDSEIIPFPSDEEMILNCSETLKPAIRDAIYRNRGLIH